MRGIDTGEEDQQSDAAEEGNNSDSEEGDASEADSDDLPIAQLIKK